MSDCPICMDPMEPTEGNIKNLRCGHHLHQGCYDRLARSTQMLSTIKCPMCRAPETVQVRMSQAAMSQAPMSPQAAMPSWMGHMSPQAPMAWARMPWARMPSWMGQAVQAPRPEPPVVYQVNYRNENEPSFKFIAIALIVMIGILLKLGTDDACMCHRNWSESVSKTVMEFPRYWGGSVIHIRPEMCMRYC